MQNDGGVSPIKQHFERLTKKLVFYNQLIEKQGGLMEAVAGVFL